MEYIQIDINELRSIISESIQQALVEVLRPELRKLSSPVQPGSYIARKTAALELAEAKRKKRKS